MSITYFFKQWAKNGNSSMIKTKWQVNRYIKTLANHLRTTLEILWKGQKTRQFQDHDLHFKAHQCNLDAVTLLFIMLGTICFRLTKQYIWLECLLYLGARLAMKLTLAISFINIHPQMGMHLECDDDWSQQTRETQVF